MTRFFSSARAKIFLGREERRRQKKYGFDVSNLIQKRGRIIIPSRVLFSDLKVRKKAWLITRRIIKFKYVEVLYHEKFSEASNGLR